jgi:class 3 adenylate cyclase/predicted ATPase
MIGDLEGFLKDLGLSQYVQTFHDNDIDMDALLYLEEAHLKELGVSLGHRLKLANAIAALRANREQHRRAVETQGAEIYGTAATRESGSANEGERRQLTLMFCDLVGSTELAAGADPEEVRDVMRVYQDVCAGMIARYDGYLAKFLGDGVLAYFGYPHAYEDAAERAVRAARGIVAAVSKLPPRGGHQLTVRVGIATGTVVVSQLKAADGASELSAIGETPNLAARLQALAEPNTVVIADSTRALTRGAFRYNDLGLKPLKGMPEPVRTWQVVEELAADRFEAAHISGMSSLIGREQEVELLHARWEQATSGEGQAVLLCGEGGIGKSRIAEQLRERIGTAKNFRVRYQCTPFHTNSALQPAIVHLEHAAGIADSDDDDKRLTKLQELLRATTPDLDRVMPLFASLLNISTGKRYPTLHMTADVIKRRTLEALADQAVALSRTNPVYWLIEDIHWVDPTTREHIGICLDRIRDARIFMLLTFRPEFVPPWAHMPHVTALTLNRLTRRQCVELVEILCGGRKLPTQVLEQVIAKTDGIPLFIEELTKSVLESDLLKEADGGFELKGALPPMAIPSTLQDTLMARLDRLSSVRDVAQIGAAIGRAFSYELLAAVAPGGSNELTEALTQLTSAEIILARGQPPEATYIFKHALLQDAAYSSLLRTRRQQLHARIAEVLEQKFWDISERRPEILAHHYGAAGLDDQAKRHWMRATQLALAQSNYAEAIAHSAHALEMVRKAPPSSDRSREESQLLNDQAMAFSVVKGPGSADAGRLAEEAVMTSAPLGDDPLHFRARWNDWRYRAQSGDLGGASERADILVEMASRSGATDLRLQAHHARWTTAFVRGQVAVTREAVECGLALYDFEQHKDHWAVYGGHDPGVCARATGACTLWQAGLSERGAAVAEDAIRVAHNLGHPYSQSVALWYAGFFAMMVGDAASARAHAERLAEHAAEGRWALVAAMSKIIAAWAVTQTGEIGSGAQQMEAEFRNFLHTKQRAYLTFLGTLVVGAKLEMDSTEEVLNLLDEIEQLSIETHQQMFIADLHRLRAEALRRLDRRHEGIEQQYRLALRIARQQGAPALELRAATGLASWFGEAARCKEAHDLLRPVYDKFTEGLGTRDLKAARMLLDQLA